MTAPVRAVRRPAVAVFPSPSVNIETLEQRASLFHVGGETSLSGLPSM